MLLIGLLGLSGCAPTDEGPATRASGSDVDTGLFAGPDPFAPLPDPQTGLTDVSADLDAVLENGTLLTACDDYEADPTDVAKKLKCGKAMFFYEDFDGAGVPTAVFDWIPNNLTQHVGPAWSRFGLIRDPDSPQGRPLGFPEGLPMAGGSKTVAFGCAACHFGRLPDGRFAVGMPNLDYDYSGHMLTVGIAPQAVAPGFSRADHHPDAVAAVEPILDELRDRPLLRASFGLALLELLGEDASAGTITTESEGYYASWPPGTMDFVIEPLPLDDDVHIVSRILPLWEIPTTEEAMAHGAPHAQLAWTGAAPTLMDFLRGFIAVTGSADDWPDARLEPLHDYLLTLRAPVNPNPPDPVAVDAGRRLFAVTGCADCHAGPRGGGLEPYAFDEVQTDPALMQWGDADLDGTLCCGMDSEQGGGATHAVKAPRLTGLWTQTRLLHNGSLDSLESLLCLEPRAQPLPIPNSNEGHTYGCELPEEERWAILSFLLAI
jgi:mono/diheme cytochrome c family protein